MSNVTKNEELQLDDTVKTSSTGRPILGVLRGPCADFINSTRNGRKYDESLWEKVFNDPIVKEYFNCGGIPGELDHPTDRTETCSEKIAIMMPNPPEKDEDGHLIATFDILDTPNGRIAYTLAKYGYKLGISSRGSGDTYTGDDGDEHVDEDSYDFQAFDLVLLPAVKAARLDFEPMHESMGKTKASFKKALSESIQKSTDDEKKIMLETLKNLGIKYSQDGVDIDAKLSETVEAVNNGAKAVRDLQESLKKQRNLEQQISKLQEQLSVCYAKESKFEELSESYSALKKEAEKYKKSNSILQSRLSDLTSGARDANLQVKELSESLSLLKEDVNSNSRRAENLRESLREKDGRIRELTESVTSLKSSLASTSSMVESLKEENAELKKDYSIKNSEYTAKISKSNSLAEKYKGIAKRAVDKYIGLQSKYTGISSEEIMMRLPESYSLNDIDRLCESMMRDKVSVSKLPFNVGKDKISMKITESKKVRELNEMSGDDVDDTLVALAGLK